MKRILIVDDEIGFLNMLEIVLTDAGYIVLKAQSGEEGLKKARVGSPDLIISDILMPGMDGFVLFKELRTHKKTAKIPILILTARPQMEDSFRAIGVDDFLEKPSEPQVLISKIESIISYRKIKAKISKKVLIAGTDEEVVGEIVSQLKKIGCETEFVFSGPEIISKSVEFEPKVIIMEIQMDGDRAADDIIKAVRLMPQFSKIPILVYSFYRMEDLGIYEFQQKARSIDDCQRECVSAGATKYIGRFEEANFLKKISDYL